jgi:hypothetical protein
LREANERGEPSTIRKKEAGISNGTAREDGIMLETARATSPSPSTVKSTSENAEVTILGGNQWDAKWVRVVWTEIFLDMAAQ